MHIILHSEETTWKDYGCSSQISNYQLANIPPHVFLLITSQKLLIYFSPVIMQLMLSHSWWLIDWVGESPKRKPEWKQNFTIYWSQHQKFRLELNRATSLWLSASHGAWHHTQVTSNEISLGISFKVRTKKFIFFFLEPRYMLHFIKRRF